MHTSLSFAVIFSLGLTLLLGSSIGCCEHDLSSRTRSSTIIGGSAAGRCAWPTVVALLFDNKTLCSGTLIAPQVVVSAAHCFDGVDALPQVLLGEDLGQPARTLTVTRCAQHPDWVLDQGTTPQDITPYDFAFCLLEEAVTNLHLVPILMGCETEVLSLGARVVMVGFGRNDQEQSGLKHAVETAIFRASARVVSVGSRSAGSAPGDSGGPNFIKNQQGEWRVFGVTSSSTISGVIGETNLALLHREIPWLEQQSGLDLTPCHEADGSWAPAAACGRFSLAPHLAEGDWNSGCSPELTPLSTACGPSWGSTASGDGMTPAAGDRWPLQQDSGGCTISETSAAPSAPFLVIIGVIGLLIFFWPYQMRKQERTSERLFF